MYSSLGTVHLKSGEQVEAGVIITPDEEWRERVQKLLWHKEELWRLANHPDVGETCWCRTILLRPASQWRAILPDNDRRI